MSQLTQAFETAFSEFASKELVTFKKDFAYERYTYEQMGELTRRMVTWLAASGIKQGDRIAIASYNCPAYLVTMYACILSGVVLVPLDFGASAGYCQKLMKATKAKMLIRSRYKLVNFPENEKRDSIASLQNDKSTTRDSIAALQNDKHSKRDSSAKPQNDIVSKRDSSADARRDQNDKRVVLIEQLFELLADHDPAKKLPDVADDALIEILYTSGTTGEPKGVMVSHGNVMASISGVKTMVSVTQDFRILSMLPLSHIFEQVVGMALTVSGASIVQMKSRRGSEISLLLKRERINTLATVPAFLELFKRRIMDGAEQQGKLATIQKLLDIAPKLPRGVRRILFSSVHKKMGGSLTKVICGGAPLRTETEIFWDSLGMEVYKGYGLTETAPVVSITPDGQRRTGAVGRPIPGMEVRIGDEAEIQVKGPNVMQGYYDNDSANKKVFTKDGWFRTGDVGEVDSDGYVYLRGRVKNMILKANGKNVYPEDIENILNRDERIREACVVGIEHAHDTAVTAVILQAADVTLTKKDLKAIVDATNAKLETYQQIQDVVLWQEPDFPRTLTLKVKRREVVGALTAHGTGKGMHVDPLISLLSDMTHKKADAIDMKDVLYEDLGLDSLAVIQLAVRIEEILRVQIPQHLITTKTTVAELSELVAAGSQPVQTLKMPRSYYWDVFDPLRRVWPRLTTWIASGYFEPLVVQGKQHLREVQGPVIVAANHTSMLDTSVLYDALPWRIRQRLAIAGREDYFFSRPGIGGRIIKYLFMTIGQAFPLVREADDPTKSVAESFAIAGDLVDRGYSIMLYPEGTRNPSDELIEFKRGLGLLVQETSLPVLPVRLLGLNHILPRGSNWPVGGHRVEVRIGELMRFGVLESPEEVTEKVKKKISDLGS